MNLLNDYAAKLDELKQQGNLRQFTSNVQHGRMIEIKNQKMLNL
ncbi:MAG: 8-amino-7-oxononanoate synthase, partial [Acinetobacter sp.]